MKIHLSGADSLASLLQTIADAGKYVSVTLSRCTMSGTGFDPDNTGSAGKDRVVSLTLPDAAQNIKAATRDGEPAFLHFTSLKTVGGSAIRTIGLGAFYGRPLASANFPVAATIDGWAFAQCKALTSVNLPAVTSISFYKYRYQGTHHHAGPERPGAEQRQCRKCSRLRQDRYYQTPADSTGWQKLFKYQFGLENRGSAITLRFQDL